MISACFLKIVYEHELQELKTPKQTHSLRGGYRIVRSMYRKYFRTVEMGSDSVVVSEWKTVALAGSTLLPSQPPISRFCPRCLCWDLAQVHSPLSLRGHYVCTFSLHFSAPMMFAFLSSGSTACAQLPPLTLGGANTHLRACLLTVMLIDLPV